LTGPAIGGPDSRGAAPARTGFWDAAGGILVLLAVGLALRLIIAYLLPGSGFRVDISSFQFWANELADHGINGFYARAAAPQHGFFADYTPGYLYVLWLVGTVGNVVGGVGDFIKIPPILGDLALAYLVWSMVRELGGSERAAKLGALIVLLNPVTWFDSVVWGQVDSVGVVALLLSVRELWRDRPERSAILAATAALIKPQLGIMIPIVAVVVIRRALRPKGGHGAEEPPEERSTTTPWERTARGPLRILTTGLAGFLTAIVLSVPFGLSLPGLVSQVFKTAGGYPYTSVNAFNPWALVSHTDQNGQAESIALNRAWVCDTTILASKPSEFRIGPWVIPELSSPGSAIDKCPDALMIGAFPALYVGAALFLIAAALALSLVARRPDRLTILVGLAVLALAFFVLPTRVHERYLFPFVAIAAIPAAVSLRWRVAYVLSGAATFANMYVILTTYYRDNPRITDWLGIGQMLASYPGVALAAVIQAAVLAWALFQLREEAVEGLAEDVELAGRPADEQARLAPWRGRPAPEADELDLDRLPAPAGAVSAAAAAGGGASPGGGTSPPLPRWAAALAGGSPWPRSEPAADTRVTPVWRDPRDAPPPGPWAWFRARLSDTPVRADRSRELNRERGGRLDRLDVWVLALLAVTLLTVRMWRLAEPYQMHFDEVYHPRTATEFLQDWRYGISHYIYEWTHPHMAKYAMALGIEAFGEDRTGATSDLGVPVVAAAIEPRRDDGLDPGQIEGDRLWVATGSEVRAYDLGTRRLAATLQLPGAVALGFDRAGYQLYVGTSAGAIEVIDTTAFDVGRGGAPVEATSSAYTDVRAPIASMFVTRDGERLVVQLEAGVEVSDPSRSMLLLYDTAGANELGRTDLPGVTQVNDTIGSRILIANRNGLAFLNRETGRVEKTVGVGGPASGVVGINDIQDDPIYVPYLSPDGPRVAMVIAKQAQDPTLRESFKLPGTTAGRAYFDLASRMVHVEGSVPAADGGTGGPTVYVIEPHANAVYADAALPFSPSAIVMDDNQQYQSGDRQQLLAFDAAGGVASVEIGKHALAWRIPGVIAGVLMALFLYVLARLLFRRRSVAVFLAVAVVVDGMLFAQSRIGMNDSYVGLGIVAAYTIFAALWLNPGNSRRHWLAFALGVPLMGGFLGFALASKWVAAYAIGGLGILVLARSALGRALLLIGLVVLTTALGYVAISVAPGQTGGNYVFLGLMVGLVVVGVLANVLHPIAWTWEEYRFAIGAPAAVGLLAIVYGLARGNAASQIAIGPVSVTPIELGLLALLAAGAIYTLFVLLGRYGFGPLAAPPGPDDPAAILEPPAAAPEGWLRLGSGYGLPAVLLVAGLIVIPIELYVLSYVPWAFVENHQLIAGWPPGHTGDTLLQLTASMYDYHNNLSSAHPASSPWWAWLFDLKPVWFYEEGFAGGTSASIYDAGNLVAWWLGVPAMAFVAWQAYKRRSPALALVAIGFAVQWLSWARIDRAAFQYHYYTALPFLFLALGYFLAELWHGPSRRTWLLARLAAGAAVLAPFGMYLLHRPLCAIAQVTVVNPGSQACPTVIPEATITARAVSIAVVVGVGVLLLVRELLTVTDEDAPADVDAGAASGWRGALARLGLGGQWATIGIIALGTSVAFVLVATLLPDAGGLKIANVPVEPIALVVTLALTPVAAYVATARDSRRFVVGALGAMVFWFVLWYPNISGLPLPAAQHNAYQGFLPTYLYPFQFWVATQRPASPSLLALGPAVMLLALAFTAIVVGYSAWSWRIALAERRRDLLANRDDGPRLAVGAD
jgi:Gpi18-like mannosyltransferase